MHILIVGCGKMADAVEHMCASQIIPFTNFEEILMESVETVPADTVAIHFGSGRNLLELIDFCGMRGIPIIQGSTKLSTPIPGSLYQQDANVTIIDAPNLSLPMIRFIKAFPDFARAISPNMKTTIVESHQSTKADTSGTARAIASELGIPESEIAQIRDPRTQRALGVPENRLDGHAVHNFIFSGQGVKIEVTTEIMGRDTYAEGALALAKALDDCTTPLSGGVFKIQEFLHLF